MLSVRKALVKSHIAAVAIAVLLLGSFSTAFEAAWQLLSPLVGFLFTAVAIFDIPYFSYPTTRADRALLISIFVLICFAVIIFAEACFLSYFVYGVGPFRVLGTYRARLERE